MTDLFSQHSPADYIDQDGVRYWREDLVTLKKKQDASGFDAFWDKVPGSPDSFKIGKEKSKREFSKLKADDKQSAINSVGPFYAHWRKKHPDAAKLHPERFLKDKRWQDEGWEASSADSRQLSQRELMERDARDIKSGKRFLCAHITAAKARALIAAEMVSLNECRDAGVNV